MRESVEKYHGFYIGRYETGDLSKTKVVTTKNNNNISGYNWYVQYQKSKSIAEETNTTSSMIWGCQWDATMKWFSKDSSTAEYVTSSREKGNFTDNKVATGSNERYKVKNIYDMSGNVWDWTIETFGWPTYRTLRGGRYENVSDCQSACVRGTNPGNDPYDTDGIAHGSRSMLVI